MSDEPEFGRTREGALDPNWLAHEIEVRGRDWADKDAAADLLEKTAKSVLAQITNSIRGQSVDLSRKEAEDLALGSDQYEAHIETMVEARRVANIARANFDAVKVRIEAMRTAEATKRAEISAYRGRG